MGVEILLGVVQLEADEEALTLFRPASERHCHVAGKDIARPEPRKIAVVAEGVVQAAIETHGLRRVFKTRKQVVEAVAGVDLMVRTGEIFRFLGPNGAGKTTTLRMLATRLPPSGGKATAAGCNLPTQPERRPKRIGSLRPARGS